MIVIGGIGTMNLWSSDIDADVSLRMPVAKIGQLDAT